MQVIRRSNAKKALNPRVNARERCPARGEARNVRSQVLWAVGDSQTDTSARGHITEEPCAAVAAAASAVVGLASMSMVQSCGVIVLTSRCREPNEAVKTGCEG